MKKVYNCRTWPQGYKAMLILNSNENGISSAHNNLNIELEIVFITV